MLGVGTGLVIAHSCAKVVAPDGLPLGDGFDFRDLVIDYDGTRMRFYRPRTPTGLNRFEPPRLPEPS